MMSSYYRISIYFLPVVFLILGSSDSFAQKEVGKDFTFNPETSTVIPKYAGKVILSKGRSTAYDAKSGAERVLGKNSKVYKKEEIRTEGKTFLKIRLIDQTIVTLGPKTRILVESFKFKTAKDRSYSIRVLRGKFRGYFRHKSDPGKIKIKAQSYALGIRGTKALVNNNTVAGQQVVQMALLTGQAIMENESEPGQKMNLKPGSHFIAYKKRMAERFNLEQRLLKRNQMLKLLATERDDKTEFKPLLNYHQPAADESSSQLQPDEANSRAKNIAENVKQEESQKSWKNPLKKLNQRLKENNSN